MHADEARAETARADATIDADKTTQGESLDHEWPIPEEKLRRKLAVPSQGRLYYIRYALKMGWTIEQIHELTKIDPWFLAQMKAAGGFRGRADRRSRCCADQHDAVRRSRASSPI